MYKASSHQMLHHFDHISFSSTIKQDWKLQKQIFQTYVQRNRGKFALSHHHHPQCPWGQVNVVGSWGYNSLYISLYIILFNSYQSWRFQPIVEVVKIFLKFSNAFGPSHLGYSLKFHLTHMLPSNKLPSWLLLPHRIIGVHDIMAYFMSTIDITPITLLD